VTDFRIAAVPLAAAALAGTVALAARRSHEHGMTREIDTLLADARRAAGRIITERDLGSLPEPVQRWLRYSRVIGRRSPTTARLRQEGHFRLEGMGWMPFTAEQYFTVEPPGFLWKANFRMASVLSVMGRDAYRSGKASIDMRALSLVPVAHKAGGGLDQGALLRFLGELQWLPAAALADYVTWEAADPNTARATMSYGGIAASMTFRFADNGRLIEERAMRYNDSRERNEAWVNRNDSDRECDGVRVPGSGEARWEYDSGPFPYIRWRITALDFDRPARFTD
jgi:hypothetical protein